VSSSVQNLEAARALIRRRKRSDRIFNLVGAGLIVLSLLVLGGLIAGLVHDGAGRLFSTHEVKPDGQPPGFREVVGTVRRAPDGAWILQQDPIELRVLSQQADEVAALAGRRVAVRGELPRAGERLMQADAVLAIPESLSPGQPIPGDPDIVGQLIRPGHGGHASGAAQASQQALSGFVLCPDPMRLELSDGKGGQINLSQFEGRRVAVDAGRRGRKPALALITATDIAPLRSRSFFASMPSMSPSRAGILPGVVGTLLVMLVTMIFAIPLGVAAGIYLEEYAPKNKFTALIELNIANLAGVPSIIWGLAGLALFIFALHLERSVLSAGLTLGLLVLPIVIISTREAIRAVPNTVREAAVALGATRWQATRYHVLPYSLGGILTGSIIAMSRAIGETAPLVVIGAVLFISFLPPWPVQPQPPFVNLEFLNSKFTVVPMQIFDWVSRPQPEFHANAAAASLVLLAMTLGLNAIAIALRFRARKSIKW